MLTPVGFRIAPNIMAKGRILKASSLVFAFLLIVTFYGVFQAQAESMSGVQVQIVDALGNGGNSCSLALDPDGNPHISYTDGNGSGLKYASWNGSKWEIRVVDSGGVTGSDGMHNSLRIDSNGNPHISYCAYDANRYGYLKYACWNGADWNTQTVDPEGSGWFTSLALDSEGDPHISYYGYYSLQYASWDGTKWDIQVVDPGRFAYDDSMISVGWYSSLTFDSNDNPYISYYHKTNGDLKYANWNGSGWNIQTVDSEGDIGLDTSLALDSSGNAHISYRGDTGLKYAAWNGSGWSIQIIDTTGNPRSAVGEYSSLVLDSGDKPQICYIDNYRVNLLKYAFLNGSSWEIHVLSEILHGGYSTSMALDYNEKVHIAHGDYTSHVLNYVFIDPAALPPSVLAPDPVPPTPPTPFNTSASPAGTVKIIDSLGNTGTYTSLAMDSEGNPHISYCEGNIFLKYAYCDNTTWHVETVDHDGWPGLYTSIAIDQNDNPCISYYANYDRELRYAEWNGSAWNIQVVDSECGGFTSLAIDAQGKPHISYFDGVKSELKYAKWNGSSWCIQTVDSEWRVGECTSIALDSYGNPHISYYDIQQSNLKYASWTSSGWHIQIVEWEGNVGWSTSLEIDSNDKPHISYLDGSKKALKYAVLNDYDWDIQVVDSVGTANYQTWRNFTSLALDSNEYPRISYFDGENGMLKHALWNGSSWLIQIADSTYDVGWCSSLALDSDDRTHISYCDASNRDLRYICSQNATGFPTEFTTDTSTIQDTTSSVTSQLDPLPTLDPTPVSSDEPSKLPVPTSDPTTIREAPHEAPALTPWIALPLFTITTVVGGLIHRKKTS